MNTMASLPGADPSKESPNLRALRNVVDRWMTEVTVGLKGADRLPEYLASQGVLVVGSLTDDELAACGVERELGDVPMERAEIAATVRQRLERFARGDGKLEP